MAARTFTPEEANEALAEVAPLVERMVEQHGALAGAERRRAELGSRIAGNGGGIEPSELAQAEAAVKRATAGLARCLRQIQELGVQVKGPGEGLVDFPSVREGREVLLCWRHGEEAVGFWHRPDEGFAGRKPLPF